MNHLCLGLLSLGGFLLLSLPAEGDQPLPAEPTPATSTLSAEQISQLIADLDSEKFTARDNASVKLLDGGLEVVEPLAEAMATTESREVSSRCGEILRRMASNAQLGMEVRSGARAALSKLSQNANAKVAAQAKELVATIPSDAPDQLPRGGVVIPGAQLDQFRRLAGNRQLQIRNINGQMQREIQENGRRISIKEGPQGQNLTITISEPDANGQDKINSYAAKDLEELRKNHPQAAEIYQKFTQNNRPFEIAVDVGPNFPAIPQPLIAPQPARFMTPMQTAIELRRLQKELTADLKELKQAEQKIPAGTPGSEELKASIQKLEALRQQMEKLVKSNPLLP